MKSSFNFKATGTTWQIEVISHGGGRADESEKELRNPKEEVTLDIAQLEVAVKLRVEEFESVYSRFRADSLMSRIAQDFAHGPARGSEHDLKFDCSNSSINSVTIPSAEYIFPEDDEKLFGLYRKMYVATNGLVTPLIGQVISDAGYDAQYSLNPKNKISAAKKWDDVMEYNHPMLTVREPVMLDFGAIGKGYLIDIVGKLLEEKGFKNYTVNAGGDIRHRAESDDHAGVAKAAETGSDLEKIDKPLRIGLEHPDDAKQVIGVAEIFNKSICGSAGNRRAWREYHHIINPDTVSSPKHISAVWVVVDSKHAFIDAASAHSAGAAAGACPTAIADALTTGLFFMEPEELASRSGFKFEYLIVYADNAIRKSLNFPAKMF